MKWEVEGSHIPMCYYWDWCTWIEDSTISMVTKNISGPCNFQAEKKYLALIQAQILLPVWKLMKEMEEESGRTYIHAGGVAPSVNLPSPVAWVGDGCAATGAIEHYVGLRSPFLLLIVTSRRCFPRPMAPRRLVAMPDLRQHGKEGRGRRRQHASFGVECLV